MMNFEKDFLYENKQELTNGAPWSLTKCWECAIHQYGLPFLQYCMNIIYAVYVNYTVFNMVFFLVKTVPTGLYVGNLIRNMYVTSRERMRRHQSEMEDLQLQIQIINAKLRLREAEFLDRTEELRKATEIFHKVRARVLQTIATDEELRNFMQKPIPWEDNDTHIDSPLAEEREFILQLLKELKYDQEAAGEGTELNEMSSGWRAPSEPTSLPDESVYSSATEAEVKQNCHVKIVKVTNVYKVDCLKHYIKQKKIRRATKHAVLKKKVETVKQFLEEWQKTLDMVINSKISRYVEAASQKGMGDYTKQDLRDFSDTDSEIRNFNDNYYEPVLSWAQNTSSNFPSVFEEVPDTAVAKEISELQYSLCQYDSSAQPERSAQAPNSTLAVLPEETASQMAIEEIRSEADDEYKLS